MTATCRATPHDITGSASVVDASVVAVVAGQRLDVATITPEGVRLGLLDVGSPAAAAEGIGVSLAVTT